jgi:hypothetical protein
MDRFTRNSIIFSAVLLALLVLSLTWSSFGWTPRIWQFNARLQEDPVLTTYPYQFRAVLFVTGIVTLTSPHADEVALEPFLRVVDPTLREHPADAAALTAAQERFAQHEQRAIALLLAEEDVDSVIWSLDRAWYHQHKLPLPPLAQ